MKKKIALVTGGFSGEAVISYRSATTIYNHLDKDRFDVYKIDINRDGWFYDDGKGKRSSVNKNDFTIQCDGKPVSFDAVFIGMHGTPGEDGKLQGYFDMMGLPYTCCNSASSALTFNKRYTVAVANMAGIPVASSVHLFKHTPYNLDAILSQVTLPYFVKPNNGGFCICIRKGSEEGKMDEEL